VIVDSSAVIAVLLEEPEAAWFRVLLTSEADVRMSAVTDFETRLIAVHRRGPLLVERHEELLTSSGITIAPFDATQAALAFSAYRRYGKGNHPAKLTFADCAAYALAKGLDMPLLFKGEDFARTDVRRAL
jgi:ribonuclease VapC